MTSKAYYAANRERLREEARQLYRDNREDMIKREKEKLYGVTWGCLEQLLVEQEGLCPVCSQEVKMIIGERTFTVDHDHACCPGKKACGRCIRGILHETCNKSLGFLEKFEATGQIVINEPLRSYVWRTRGA